MMRPLVALRSGVLPWYPAAGIGVAFLVRAGPSGIPLLFLARLALMLWPTPVREAPLAFVLDAGILVAVHAIAASWIRRHIHFAGGIWAVRDCAMCIAVLCGAALAAGFAGGLAATLRGGGGTHEFWLNVLGFALGDATGMLLLVPALVLAPALLPGRDRRRDARAGRLREVASLTMFALLVVALDAMLSRHGNALGRYLWFLPLIWAALTDGLRGAALMGAFFAVAITAFAALGLLPPPQVLPTQALLVTLAIAGLLVATARTSARESEARYWHVLATANEGIWRLDPEGLTVDLNDRMAEMLGTKAEEVLGLPALGFIAPESREAWLGQRKARQGGAHSVYETVLVQAGGGRRNVLVSASPVWSPTAKRVTGSVALVTDITGWRAEEARRKVSDHQRERAEILLETIFRTSPDAMILFRARDELIVDVNDTWCRTTGFRREDVIGRSQRELGIWSDLRDSGRLTSILEEHGQVEGFEFAFQRRLPDGETEDGVAVLSARSATLAGERYLLCVGKDVTLERRAQQERAQDQRLEDLGRLASGIAHDLNNMLAVIGFYGETVKRDALAQRPADAEAISELSEAVQRGHALTKRLLSFSRSKPAAPDTLDLDAVIRGFAGILRPILGDRVEQRLELAGNLPPIVGDPNEVGQILLNLATNARDAMPDGGTLTIRTGTLQVPPGQAASLVGPGVEPGEYVVLELADTGHGMDEATRRRAFEPFFTTKPEGKGTGLGLSVVYGILRRAHGAVRVDSAQGKGTRFRLFWPRADPESRGPRVEERANVLIATADGALRAGLRRDLEADGILVREVVDELAALQAVRGGDGADLVICDAGGGRLDGWQLARNLAVERPELPVVIIAMESGPAPAALPNVKRIVRRAPEDLSAIAVVARTSIGGLSTKAHGGQV